MTNLTMSAGRDYRAHGRYEYVIFDGETVVARQGFFRSKKSAVVAGRRKAQELLSAANYAEMKAATEAFNPSAPYGI